MSTVRRRTVGSVKRILVLDDDPYFLGEMEERLSFEGFSVLCARDVHDAQRLLEREAPDLVIVDLFLEGDTGDELSNTFISKVLEPGGFSYFRASSAPSLIPAGLRGAYVLDKRRIDQAWPELLAAIEELER
jgi:DNA-binding NarL/FixJ family response regulator